MVDPSGLGASTPSRALDLALQDYGSRIALHEMFLQIDQINYVFPLQTNNNNTIARTNTSQPESKVKEHSKLIKSPSVDLNPQLAGIKKRGNLRVTGQETEGECGYNIKGHD